MTEITWKVIGQRQALGADERGNIVDGMNVIVETSDGVVFTVFVPMSKYNVDEVRKIIQARVDRIAEIGGLSGNSSGYRAS